MVDGGVGRDNCVTSVGGREDSISLNLGSSEEVDEVGERRRHKGLCQLKGKRHSNWSPTSHMRLFSLKL